MPALDSEASSRGKVTDFFKGVADESKGGATALLLTFSALATPKASESVESDKEGSKDGWGTAARSIEGEGGEVERSGGGCFLLQEKQKQTNTKGLVGPKCMGF